MTYFNETWNPVRGCPVRCPARCYAVRQAARMAGPGGAYEGLVRRGPHGPEWTGDVRFAADQLGKPHGWRTPRSILTPSMGELFAAVSDWIGKVAAVVMNCERHLFITWTKRPDAAAAWFGEARRSIVGGLQGWPPPNWIVGASVCTQPMLDAALPHLRHLADLGVRTGLSVEPLLGPVDVRPALPEVGPPLAICTACGQSKAPPGRSAPGCGAGYCSRECSGHDEQPRPPSDLWPGESRRDFGYPRELAERPAIDWITLGGETGPGARPCDVAWLRDIVRACREAGVPCYVKQLGARIRWGAMGGDGGTAYQSRCAGGIADARGADPGEWPADLRVREMPRGWEHLLREQPDVERSKR